MSKSTRGFASMSPEKRREIASKGGKRAHELGKAHQFTVEAAQLAGRQRLSKMTGEDRKRVAAMGGKGKKGYRKKKST